MSINYKEKLKEELKALVNNSVFTNASLKDLKVKYGFESVIHIFDVPRQLGLLNVGYDIVRDLLATAKLRESIEEVGVIMPITVAYSDALNALIVLDGGTRIEAINPSTVATWRIVNIDVTDEFKLTVALAYALNTMLNKFSMEAVAGLYRKFKPLFMKFNLTSMDVLGFHITDVARSIRISNAFKQARALILNAPDDVSKRALKILSILEDALSGNKSNASRKLRGIITQSEEPSRLIADIALAMAGETICFKRRSAGILKAMQYAKEIIKQYLEGKEAEEDWIKLLARGLDYTARVMACRSRITMIIKDPEALNTALSLFDKYLKEIRSIRKSTEVVTIAAYAAAKALIQHNKGTLVEEVVGNVAQLFGIPTGSLLSTYRQLNKLLTTNTHS